MKPWIKILVGLGILWIPVSNALLLYLCLANPSRHLLLLILSSFLSCIILCLNWIFLSIYVFRRNELSIQKRVLWIVGFIAGPIALFVQPAFYVLYILKHPNNLPLFDPLGSSTQPPTP